MVESFWTAGPHCKQHLEHITTVTRMATRSLDIIKHPTESYRNEINKDYVYDCRCEDSKASDLQ